MNTTATTLHWPSLIAALLLTSIFLSFTLTLSLSYVASPLKNLSDSSGSTCCDLFSSAEESGSAVCLCYLAHLPSSLRLGWSALGMGWVRAEIDDGAAGALLASVRRGRWRRPVFSSSSVEEAVGDCDSFSSVKVGAQRRNMGAQFKSSFLVED